MTEAMEGPVGTVRSAISSARAYGVAVFNAGFAFARAGVRSIGAFVEAGVETVAAFDSAHRSTQRPRGDGSSNEADHASVT
jgi:hypothetical protein